MAATMAAAVLLLIALVAAAAALPFHTPLWSTDVLPTETPSMATNDDMLFVVVNTSLTAVRAVDGAHVWTATVPQVPMDGQYVAPFLGANGRWVLAVTPTDAYVFDAQTGVLASTCSNCSAFAVSAVVTTQREDTFLLMLYSGQYLAILRVFSVPSTTMRILWTSSGTMLSYAVAPGTSKMYFFGDSDGGDASLYVVDLEHPQQTPATLPGVAAMSAMPVNGLVAVVTQAGAVALVDLTTASFVWTNPNAWTASLEQQATLWQTEATIAVTGATPGVPLLVFDAASGRLLANHTFDNDGWPYTLLGGPVLAAGRWVMLATDTDDANMEQVNVVAVDPIDGNVMSSRSMPTLQLPVLASVGAAHVVVPNGQGFVMLDASNASVPLSYNLYSCPGPLSISTFVGQGLFVLSNGAKLVGFAAAVPSQQ